ncbi:MAG: hypothetical protein IKO10_10080 [Lachnospiraceae bacterium]|nr:hypothetical protein [Lachnospiraceae bacterium]
MHFYEIVKKYIDEKDPERLLAMGAPDDEYDIESRKIAERITVQHSAEEIAGIIAEVINKAFDCDDSPDLYVEVAQKIRKELESIEGGME